MYNVKSMDSNEFIDDAEIMESISQAKSFQRAKARLTEYWTRQENIKVLRIELRFCLKLDDDETLEKMFKIAREIKEEIYGKRIVIFAPLYLSNYCVNNCKYCGYKCSNNIGRHQLTQEELREGSQSLGGYGT